MIRISQSGAKALYTVLDKVLSEIDPEERSEELTEEEYERAEEWSKLLNENDWIRIRSIYQQLRREINPTES